MHRKIFCENSSVVLNALYKKRKTAFQFSKLIAEAVFLFLCIAY